MIKINEFSGKATALMLYYGKNPLKSVYIFEKKKFS
jgi:hypothetical protein